MHLYRVKGLYKIGTLPLGGILFVTYSTGRMPPTEVPLLCAINVTPQLSGLNVPILH